MQAARFWTAASDSDGEEDGSDSEFSDDQSGSGSDSDSDSESGDGPNRYDCRGSFPHKSHLVFTVHQLIFIHFYMQVLGRIVRV